VIDIKLLHGDCLELMKDIPVVIGLRGLLEDQMDDKINKEREM
jgi:hypothetical protein